MKLSAEEMILKIKSGETFSAALTDNSVSFHIKEYAPYICVAPHSGHQFRKELLEHTHLSEQERLYEEDPKTGFFISNTPMGVTANDSRYEYDLNRSPEECIYHIAWGKKVWKKHLPPDVKKRSLQKHARFYQVMDALVEKTEQDFGGCLMYDVHSYNHVRHNNPNLPLFSIGTEKIDKVRFKKNIEDFRSILSKIKIKDVANRTTLDEIFMGRGHVLEHFTRQFKNTLVLSLEIKKDYCNEETGEQYPQICAALRDSLDHAMRQNASHFIKTFKKK